MSLCSTWSAVFENQVLFKQQRFLTISRLGEHLINQAIRLPQAGVANIDVSRRLNCHVSTIARLQKRCNVFGMMMQCQRSATIGTTKYNDQKTERQYESPSTAMVRSNVPVTGLCSSIKTRPRRVRRSASGGSLDVQGSLVTKNIWLFENENYKQTSSDEMSVDSAYCGSGCCQHNWWLTTNFIPSQLCSKCNKKIKTRRAVRKCTVCKGVFHLKCASPLIEATPDENRAPQKMDVTDFISTRKERTAKHVPCKVAKSKKRVPFSRLPTNNNDNRITEPKHEINNNDFDEICAENVEDFELPSDPANETTVSTMSQTKQRLAGMKNSFVKRCQSLKKKVKSLKEKVGPTDNSSAPQVQTQDSAPDSNDERSEDSDTPVDRQDSLEEERAARVRSPVLKRVRSRQAEIRAESIRRRAGPYSRDTTPLRHRRLQHHQVLDPDQSEKDTTPRRRGLQQQPVLDVDLGDIRDRLEALERKLGKLEQEIPAEVKEWNLLRLKFREDYDGPGIKQNDDCLHQERNMATHDTHLKEVEARFFPSLSSGTGTNSDEVYVVPDSSTSSHEEGGHVTQTGGYVTQTGHMTAGSDQDDSLLPSGIPDRLKLEIKGEHSQSYSDHQTSTPVTNCELSFRSASKQYAKMHLITHKNITTINMNNSTSDDSSFKLRGGNPNVIEGEATVSSKSSSDQGHRRILSPEQLAVKSFLEKRKRSSGSFICSPPRGLNLSASPPAASSTFRNGSLLCQESPQQDLSPVSFTLRNDLTGGSQTSFTRILDDSKLQDKKYLSEDPNSPVLSELTCTFRNDSQMAAMGTDENLPGYTTNYFAAQTYTTTESESEADDHPRGNRIQVAADIEVDADSDDVRLVRQDMDCTTSVDGNSLTNITEFSADEVNSFSDKNDEHYKSRWINKDVKMFYTSGSTRTRQFDKQGLGMSRPSKDARVDETGDGRKPPVPARREPAAARVDFLKEAERHLEVYKNRRQQEISPGVSLEKLPRQPVMEIFHDPAEDGDTIVKETDSVLHVTRERTSDIKTDETCEFERMEKQFQDESVSHDKSLSKSLTDISHPESSRDGGRFGRSISCSNSVDGDTRSNKSENARYHFLHEKAMTKISSPGLRMVSVSPSSAAKRGHKISDIEEESSSDLLKSGSESDINDFVIDNKFTLIANSDVVSPRSDFVSSRSEASGCKQPLASLREETISSNRRQQHLEAKLLNGYLRTVDKSQATWDNVLNWMEKDCGESGDEELQEELEKIVGLSEDTAGHGSAGHGSNSPVDDSVYYSFQGQSEELRNILSPCQEKKMQDSTINQDKDSIINQDMDDEGDDGMFTNLMETIQQGTIKQIKRLLNSDRTISEVEIKEAIAWVLEQKNDEILRLLLQDVCRLLAAAEGDNCVEAFPAYRKGRRWEPLFVVLSKLNYQGDWDSFMGFSVYRRRYDFVSSEAALVMNNDLVINNPLSLEDFAAVKSAVGQAGLQKQHSNITVISACPYRSRRGGEVLKKGLCVVINCLLKGFIPFDEEAFPEEIAGIPVDVREAYCQLGVITPPEQRRGPPQPWDEGTSVSDDTSSQATRSARSGSQSSESGQSLLQSNSSASMSSFGADLQDEGSRTLTTHRGTDTEGDVVMGPSGDTDNSVLDKVQTMDIDMGSQLHPGMKSKDYNQQLLMGTCIGPVGGTGSGTLGGFVVLQDGRHAAITCAHVAHGQSLVSQPAEAELENDRSARRCVFGRVCTEVFDQGSIDQTGVDASAINVMERFPDDARFVWARKEQLKFAGFDPRSPPRFSKGAILRLEDITPRKRHTGVLKMGAETGLTKGTLHLDGLYVRTSNREMRLPGGNQMVEFFNQMEVASVQGMSTRFFDLGDSGALVFMPLNGSDLHCIGLCIGCTSYGSCVVTPIEDVFNKLNVKSFKDFTKN